ncbi:uncharacterized protein LOC123708377 [Pieris brassicae]|uniref:uncharacterized protein LOC123708377 n=1 Tax=Pieris brassicae TaxID=7116 RepID=UPI001E6600D4|nr:uncharacterized protein LOC123708377 [Pieris brassicae]
MLPNRLVRGGVPVGTPPWELEALALGDLYRLKCETRAGDRWTELVGPARRQARDRWAHDLAMPRAGVRTVEAIRRCLQEWVNRLSFRMAQILSGHGCFGRYLHKVVRRETLPICHHCGAPEDAVGHTLADCATWSRQRHDLVSVVGTDLSLPSVVAAMLSSQEAWRAVAFFCEAAERQREVRGDGQRVCARRRRGGGAGARREELLPNSVPLRRR